MNRSDKYLDWFLRVAGWLLVMAACERFLAAAGDSQMLTFADPVLGFSIQHLTAGVGVILLACGLVCIFAKRRGIRAGLLASLMTDIICYLAMVPYIGMNGRWTCLGSLTDPLHLSRGWLRGPLEFLFLCLMAGAYGSSIFIWFRSWQIRRNYIKVACPGCGGHIEFPKNTANCKIACPHCGGGVRLQYLPKIE